MSGSPRAHTAIVAVLVALTACTVDTGPTPSPSPTAITTATTAPSPTPPAEAGPRPGGSLKYQLIHEPEFIDPGFVLESEGRAVIDALFDSLFAVGDDLQVVPAVAADWTVGGDGTLYRFVLRRDERFHDGRRVVAADFVRAFNRIVNGTPGELSPNAHHLRDVVGYEASRSTTVPLEGVRAVDERTLEVELAAPNFDLPAVLTHPSLAPVPAEVNDPSFRESPIGNGPFQMAQPWQHGRFIRVVRSDTYAGRAPLLDEVVFQIYGEGTDEDAYRDFEEGRLHYAVVPPDRLGEARALHGRAQGGTLGPGVVDRENLILFYLGFDIQTAPFNDPDVRRAISMAIDREAITSDLLDGTRVPADRLVPPGVPGSAASTCEFCRYDPEAARTLIGDREIEAVALAFNAHPGQEAIARAVREHVEDALGIRVDLVPRDFEEYVAAVREGELPFFRLGWEAEYPTPGSYLEPLLGTAAIGDTNVVRFSNQRVDELLAAARAERDTTRRHEVFAEAERIALDRVPLVPLMFYRHNRVVDDVVRDLRVRADGSVDLTAVWLADQP